VAGFDDQVMAVAGVYAESLYDVASESGAADGLLDELSSLSELLAKDSGLADFLSSPVVDAKVRAAAIEKVFRGRASDLFVDALQVLNRKGRSALLPSIAEAYRRRVDRAANRVDVDVRSAVPLTDALRTDLQAAIKAYSGKNARLHESVDERLLAGMVVQVGDQKFDSSAASQLARLETALLDRASRQIQQGATATEG